MVSIFPRGLKIHLKPKKDVVPLMHVTRVDRTPLQLVSDIAPLHLLPFLFFAMCFSKAEDNNQDTRVPNNSHRFLLFRQKQYLGQTTTHRRIYHIEQKQTSPICHHKSVP